jgi:hypothetical protein
MTAIYSQLPTFPRFHAINTAYTDNVSPFEGVKNIAINVLNDDYVVIDGINVVRSLFNLLHKKNSSTVTTGNITNDYNLLGSVWLYKTFPYLTRGSFTGYEYLIQVPDTVDPSLIEPLTTNLSSWDVYQHYSSTLPNSIILNPVVINNTNGFEGNDNRWSGVDVFDTLVGNSQNATDYFAGKWDKFLEWKYYDGSFVNDNYNSLLNFQVKFIPTVVEIRKANYIHLLSGFPADPRKIADLPVLSNSVNCTIGYYRENKLEAIPNLRTIDWVVKDVNSNILPLIDCTLGTLHISDPIVKDELINLPTITDKYPFKYYFPEYLSELFQVWEGMINTTLNINTFRVLGANNNYWNNRPIATSDLNADITHPMFAIDNQRSYNWHIKPQSDGSYGDLVMDSPRIIELHAALNASQYLVENSPLHKLDYYIKNSGSGTNVKLDQIHTALNISEYLIETPAFIGTGTIDNPQTPAAHKLDWYIKNSSIPTAITDKITAIWKALGGDKYATNIIDAARDKITNLGFLIENIARVNGLRFNDDGDIDLEKERDLYRHKTIENPSLGLPSSDGKYNDYSVSCFGKIGMIVPHLPTTYKAGGKAVELFDVVHDNQQLAIAILRQLDVSLSIQHGSEIRLKGIDGKVQAYPNQLAVNLECLQRLEKIGYQTDKNLLVSTVTGTEVRELFSGIGIPVTQKVLSLTDPKNSKAQFSIPYFGHQKNKPSTAQLLTTVQINLAVINGVLMPKKQPQASITNPFKRFMAPK